MATTDNSAHLVDDGTMDTVIACGRCGRETRYNAEGDGDDEYSYADFVRDCIDDVNADCMHCDDEARS